MKILASLFDRFKSALRLGKRKVKEPDPHDPYAAPPILKPRPLGKGSVRP